MMEILIWSQMSWNIALMVFGLFMVVGLQLFRSRGEVVLRLTLLFGLMLDPLWFICIAVWSHTSSDTKKDNQLIIKRPENPLAFPKFHTFNLVSAAQGHRVANHSRSVCNLLLIINGFPLNNEQRGAV